MNGRNSEIWRLKRKRVLRESYEISKTRPAKKN